MARLGKIARFPLAIREQINHRLLDGERAGEILPWLNLQPEVRKILADQFDAKPVNDQNLSDWRMGGYADWLGKRERVERTREMAQWSVKLAKAGGGNLAEGAASILSGEILDVLENLDDLVSVSAPAEDPDSSHTSPTSHARVAMKLEAIDNLTIAVARLRRGDHDAEAQRLGRGRLDQSAEALTFEREKFQTIACDKFLEWRANTRAVEIADDQQTSRPEKIKQLRALMFGDLGTE